MEIDGYECLFITQEHEKSRLKNLFKAIDSDTTELFFDNNDKWRYLHGLVKTKHRVERAIKPVKSVKIPFDYIKSKRDCFGVYEQYHNFCNRICTYRDKCKEATI